MELLEKESKATFIKMWDAISQPSESSFKEVMSMIHPEFRGYGTTRLERYTSRDSLKSFLSEQFRQAPDGFSYKILQIDFKQINEFICELFVESSFEIRTPRGPIPMDLIRMTFVMGEN